MSRPVLYVAHAVRPTEDEVAACRLNTADPEKWDVKTATRRNVDRAMAWLRWLRRSFPETTFIAPWIASILAGDDDSDPAQREVGIVDAYAVIERCDGIVLVGPRISEGMWREKSWGVERGWCRTIMWNPKIAPHEFEVYDLTRWSMRLYGGNPPKDVPLGHTWASMCDLYRAEWTQ